MMVLKNQNINNSRARNLQGPPEHGEVWTAVPVLP